MKTIKLHLFCLATSIVLFAHAQTVPAQYTGPYQGFYGGSFNNPISAQMSTMLWNRVFYPKAYGNSSKSPSSSNTRTPAPHTEATTNKTPDESILRFRPAGTHITTRKLADQLGNTPAEREQYLKLMNAVIDEFDQRVKEAGLQNDIAIALSYFLAENARIYHGTPELSDQQYVDIRNVIAEALLSLNALNNLTDRQKQEFYEGLVAYTGVTQWGYEQSRQANNAEMAKLYQKVAGQNLQTVTKTSPNDINLGPNGLSTGSGNSRPSRIDTDRTSLPPVSSSPIDIYQLRQDYSENEVRADQLYKGKRFLFNGTVVEVSSVHYKTDGQDATGRYTYTNVGANLKVTNTGAGTIIGWEVYCFFKDSRQLAQLRGQQKVAFEATVQGRENGSTSLILVDAVLR